MPEALNAPDPFFRGVLYLFLLVLALAVGLFALLRLSRRYRERLLRKPGAPTPAPDIWSMHKVPQDTESQETGDEP